MSEALAPASDAHPRPALVLLGAPAIRLAAQAVPLPDERASHLLAVLATGQDGAPRALLAQTLWPGHERDAALRNLRKALHRLRAHGWEATVRDVAGRLHLAAETDLAAFEARLAAGAHEQALALARGELLAGFEDDGAGSWLGHARSAWLARWKLALLAALPGLEPAEAERELARLRALDPHDSDLALQHMQLLAGRGRRADAERLRGDYGASLALDLGVAPGAALEAGDTQPPPAGRAATALFGRDDELETALAWLAAPQAAVLLISGPAGIGKTRLAEEVARCAVQTPAAPGDDARRVGPNRSNAAGAVNAPKPAGRPVVWLAGGELAAPEALWPALATALGVDLPAAAAPALRLGAALARLPALLVLDDAEHLLEARPGLQPLLEALLAAAPTLKLLLASRVAAGPFGSRLLRLSGLEPPDPRDPPAAVRRNSAVRLFAARAQAAAPGFDLAAEADAVARIARAVDGHPLALELVATWVRHMPVAEIAASLDAGARAGSGPAEELAGVFERSGRLAPPAQRVALQALALLPGSFDAAAVLALTGLRRSALDALVASSLVEPAAAPGRWRLHPLLRNWLQQADTPRSADPETLVRRALAHYTGAASARLAHPGREARSTLDWVALEWPNLHWAWQAALRRGQAETLAVLLPLVETHHELRGRRLEALALFDAAVAPVRAWRGAGALAAQLDAARALLLFRAGRYDDARALAQTVARRSRPAARVRSAVVAERVLGLVAWQQSRPDEALRHHERSHTLALEHGLAELLPDSALNIAIVHQYCGRLAQAERGYRQVIELARKSGRTRVQVVGMVNLGSLFQHSARAAAAREWLEPALVLANAEGLQSLRAHLLVNLAATLLALHDPVGYERLRPAVRHALAEGGEDYLARDVELLEVRHLVALGRPQQAWPHLAAALDAARRFGLPASHWGVALYAAETWLAQGSARTAAVWLAWLLAQPEGQLWEADRRDAQAHLAALPPALVATAQAAAGNLQAEALVDAVARELATAL